MTTPEGDDVAERPDVASETAPGGRRALVVALVIALVVVAVVVVALTRDGDDSEPSTADDGVEETTGTTDTSEKRPTAAALADFEGDGDDTTEEFEVALNWEIRWTREGGQRFQVELFDDDGESRGVVIEATDKREGSTFVSEAGVFHLGVVSDGKWNISIVGQRPD